METVARFTPPDCKAFVTYVFILRVSRDIGVPGVKNPPIKPC